MKPQASRSGSNGQSDRNGKNGTQGAAAQGSNVTALVTGRAHKAKSPPAPAPIDGPAPFERDSYASTALQEIMDKSVHAMAARLTAGLSPSGLAGAYADWLVHLSTSPGKQLQLMEKAAKKAVRLTNYAGRCFAGKNGAHPCIEPLPQDRRFRDEAWQQWPYNLLYQSFLLNQQWWHNATTGVRGVTKQHENVVEFATRQILDVFSPSNYLFTNPEALRKTTETGGANLVQGLENFAEDWERALGSKKPAGTEDFQVGGNLAATPGQVIYRNRLI